MDTQLEKNPWPGCRHLTSSGELTRGPQGQHQPGPGPTRSGCPNRPRDAEVQRVHHRRQQPHSRVISLLQTMSGHRRHAHGPLPVDEKNAVTILKVACGQAAQTERTVQLHEARSARSMTKLGARGGTASSHQVRSVIQDANAAGIAAIINRITYAAGSSPPASCRSWSPRSHPSPHKAQAEQLLRDAVAKNLETLPSDAIVMLKITIPTPARPVRRAGRRPAHAGSSPCRAATTGTRPAPCSRRTPR